MATAPGQTEKFKVQADDGNVVEVTGLILAREKTIEPKPIEPNQPAAPPEPQSQP